MITHYAYLSGPGGIREVVGAYSLIGASVEDRRKIIHEELGTHGHLLAIAPFGAKYRSLDTLLKAVDYLHNERKRP